MNGLKLVLRYMKKNMMRTMMTILGVTLSTVMVYGIMSSAISIYENTNKNNYEQSFSWDAFYYTDGETAKKIMAEYDSAWAISGRLYDKENASDGYCILYVSDFSKIPGFTLKKGVTPNSSKGIVLPELISKQEKARVDSTYLIYFKDNDGEKKKAKRTVNGIYDSQYCMDDWENEKLKGHPFISGECPISLMTDEMYEGEMSVFVSFADKHDLKGQTEKIANEYGIEVYDTSTYALDAYCLENGRESENYMGFRLIMTCISAFAAMAIIFVVRNSFNISVNERSHDYGILRCIGLTRKQIIMQILGEGLLTGLIGTILGIFLGHGICKLAFSIISEHFSTGFNNYGLYSDAVVRTVVMMLIASCYSMIAPVEKLFKLNPIEALRRSDEIDNSEKDMKLRKKLLKKCGYSEKKSEKSREKALAKASKITAKWEKKKAKTEAKRAKKTGKIISVFGVEVGYAYKNIVRNKNKFLMSVVTLAFAGTLLITCSTLMKNVGGWVDSIVEASLSGFSGYFQCDDSSEATTITKEISSLKCVKNTQICYSYYIMWGTDDDGKSKSTASAGISRYKNRVQLIMLNDEEWDDVIDVSKVKSDEKEDGSINAIGIGKSASDNVSEIKLGMLEGKPAINTFATVDSVDFVNCVGTKYPSYMYFDYGNESSGGNSSFIYIVKKDDDLIKSIDALTTKYSDDFMAFSMDELYVELDRDANDYFKFENYIERTYHYFEDMYSDLNDVKVTTNLFKIATEFIIGMLMVIYFLNAINMEQADISLRGGEFTILRVIGMSQKQKSKMLGIESFASVVIAMLTSLILGVFLSYFLNKALFWLMVGNDGVEYNLSYEIDFVSILISLGIMLVLGGVKMLISSTSEEELI